MKLSDKFIILENHHSSEKILISIESIEACSRSSEFNVTSIYTKSGILWEVKETTEQIYQKIQEKEI